MSDESAPVEENNEDSTADALAAIACVVIPVISIIYWLSGLPTS